MVAFDVGGREQADRLIQSLHHIPFAPSLGDVQTTLSHPCSTSHRGQDPEMLQKLGITPGLIRLSVGLEDPEDLWNDLSQALESRTRRSIIRSPAALDRPALARADALRPGSGIRTHSWRSVRAASICENALSSKRSSSNV